MGVSVREAFDRGGTFGRTPFTVGFTSIQTFVMNMAQTNLAPHILPTFLQVGSQDLQFTSVRQKALKLVLFRRDIRKRASDKRNRGQGSGICIE